MPHDEKEVEEKGAPIGWSISHSPLALLELFRCKLYVVCMFISAKIGSQRNDICWVNWFANAIAVVKMRRGGYSVVNLFLKCNKASMKEKEVMLVYLVTMHWSNAMGNTINCDLGHGSHLIGYPFYRFREMRR